MIDVKKLVKGRAFGILESGEKKANATWPLFVINGNAHENKEKLPKDQNYVLVAPHRTWWEPLYLAVAGSLSLALWQKELFKNPVLRFILKHANAFPVDREARSQRD